MTGGLQIDGIDYRFSTRQALDGVGFSVAPGRFAALLGPNGAGKSTLFALLTGLFSAPSGTIRIAGQDMSRNPRAALAQMGVVFQSPTLDLDLTIRQNLRYFAALHGLSGRAAALRIDAALDKLGIAERAGEKARDLNGGHRRRTEIARALVHKPDVLLLDEATVGLDAAAREAITDHVHALCAEDGLTVLWATHLTDEVRDSDRLIVLHEGRVIADGEASAIRGDQPLKARFLSMTDTPDGVPAGHPG
ncbi:putative ABC transporter ATP-binding protein YbhF [Roseivivax sp. THAF40]|uniref:ABC transporter ATP-binding protein n=1 Tax=unclassified Roseivivax TaxID=2639302 RepID=UPI001268D052|nr:MULTISPECIES: ABC transporter ATP-binding protein [unclassified Roseivivax]QFS83268.1 putative ABC transporter ATP-binding protein YbhF [Roseivivax sp. THAF197b]QFT47012.1 putative ABC transporter ATP-binding protein YbhF [Roseivivax sp. THAF40]